MRGLRNLAGCRVETITQALYAGAAEVMVAACANTSEARAPSRANTRAEWSCAYCATWPAASRRLYPSCRT